jgi:hypothetical protein
MKRQHAGNVTVLAPLNNFQWPGDEFNVEGLGTLMPTAAVPDLLTNCENPCGFQKRVIQEARHWLSFQQQPQDVLKAAEKVNVFLLALWIVVPTRTQVRVHFKFEEDPKEAIPTCHHDRFQWQKHGVREQVETQHLEQASGYIPGITNIYTARKRLRNALHLTFTGCQSKHWQVAYVCFSAAAEAILTYDTAPGITRRLSKSFACLTQEEKVERDTAYREFRRLYGVRSDIMHGRAAKCRCATQNLKCLAKFSDMLRELWQTVLSSPETIESLERCDDHRKEFFGNLQEGYDGPGRSMA